MTNRRRRPIGVGIVILTAGLLATQGAATAKPSIERDPITASADDGWQRASYAEPFHLDTTGPTIYLGRSNDLERQLSGGFRFHTTLTAGAHVNAAFLEGVNDFGQALTARIVGDTTQGAPDFLTLPTILARPRTSAVVAWRQDTIPMRAGYSPDISPIINELTARPGFDGTLVILVIGGAGADNQSIDWRSYDNPTGPAPLLELEPATP